MRIKTTPTFRFESINDLSSHIDALIASIDMQMMETLPRSRRRAELIGEKSGLRVVQAIIQNSNLTVMI